jgi:hypothetical protein
MANFRYFAEVNGETIRLTDIRHDGNIATTVDHFTGLTPDGVRIQAARMVEFKKFPSLHKCDARCAHAKGHKCECACGGKNHGRGA